ncbi:c-type cytochrome [Hahella ganghwensis]|uniref:c-type cytochrome n=1 Tax=Hahella ganghwensis TaxID=286420 RepID=UPI0003805C37|nr:cytochrome c [Hahella ganghwensis]
MPDKFSKSAARNIYYGGSVFFILLFLALTFQTVNALPERDNRELLTEAVARGKDVWERNNCIGCHTLMGEGAYYAPELANVFDRRGGEQAFTQFLKSWMAAQPLEVPNRRKIPQFHLTEQEVEDLAEFLKWTSKIDDNDWPPNIEG